MNMFRIVRFVGIISLMLAWLLVAVLWKEPPAAQAPDNTAVASSTDAVAEDTEEVSSALPAVEPDVQPVLSEEPPQLPLPKVAVQPETIPLEPVAPVPAEQQSVPVSAPAPTPSSSNAGLDAAAVSLRAALVNIICYVPAQSGLHSISASGVFVDSKGIILTNAHVAQYFLLKDRGADCTIRSGSPAADKYEAAPIFVSPAWLHANSNVLTEASPSGTGEYDYAFLAVTKSTNSNPLPAVFPAVALATEPAGSGTPVVIATYGAQFLESSQIQSALFPTVVFGSVKDVFTFAQNTIDVLALGGSAAAQEGSSGGGVSDSFGRLIGMITTSTIVGDTSTRSVDAITASYVRGQYATESGKALDVLLAQSTGQSIEEFAPQISNLQKILVLP